MELRFDSAHKVRQPATSVQTAHCRAALPFKQCLTHTKASGCSPDDHLATVVLRLLQTTGVHLQQLAWGHLIRGSPAAAAAVAAVHSEKARLLLSDVALCIGSSTSHQLLASFTRHQQDV
jgi:hypothetical protein